jgi:lactoylglutathione lyase
LRDALGQRRLAAGVEIIVMANSNALRAFPMLSVDDLARSLGFYRDLLGFVEAYRFPEGDSAVFVTLTAGSSEIGLGQLGPNPALHGRVQRPASGHRIELCVYVDDVVAMIERARRAGFSVVLEPVDQPWGERIAYLEDPDGNLVMLAAQSPETPRARSGA